MKIGDLSAATGVSARSLRYYEEQDLLTPGRTSGGQRVYDTKAPDRVRLVQCLYSAGLPSRTIALLLECEKTSRVSPGAIGELRRQMLQIDQQLSRLSEARIRLRALLQVVDLSVQAGSPEPST